MSLCHYVASVNQAFKGMCKGRDFVKAAAGSLTRVSVKMASTVIPFFFCVFFFLIFFFCFPLLLFFFLLTHIYQGAPKIMALDTLVDVIEKEDKMITCQADGWPPPLIKWKRNNVDIKDNDDFMIWEFPNQNQVTLTIKSVDNHHEGNYTCEASNAFGKTSQNVLVTIQGEGHESAFRAIG